MPPTRLLLYLCSTPCWAALTFTRLQSTWSLPPFVSCVTVHSLPMIAPFPGPWLPASPCSCDSSARGLVKNSFHESDTGNWFCYLLTGLLCPILSDMTLVSRTTQGHTYTTHTHPHTHTYVRYLYHWILLATIRSRGNSLCKTDEVCKHTRVLMRSLGFSLHSPYCWRETMCLWRCLTSHFLPTATEVHSFI